MHPVDVTTPFIEVYIEAPEGGYVAYARELPGANTQGETLEEARENLKDAVAMMLEVQHDRNSPGA